VTCAPRTTVTFWGDTPPLVIVIVAPPVLPPGFGVGEVVLAAPPHAPIINALAAANTIRIIVACYWKRILACNLE